VTNRTEKARAARRVRHEAIRADVAEEEMEAVEADITEKARTLDVPNAPAHRPGTGCRVAPAGG
jgi:hypothetical protein